MHQPQTNWKYLVAVVLLVGLISRPSVAQSASQDKQSEGGKAAASQHQSKTAPENIFLIGNSLTWDTLPALLDGDVSWHVDCGKSLKYIQEHPLKPCVDSSTSWATALAQEQFDVLCIQPFTGTTLSEDINAISFWLKMQPKAKLLIHTGWNRAELFESAYHAPPEADERPRVWADDSPMEHSPEYFTELERRLEKLFPDRDIQSTATLQLLDSVYHDISEGRAPFKAFAELYRDDIHMTTQVGRYLMHNRMRQSLGQPLSDQGFQVDGAVREYLDQKLKSR